MIGGYLYWKVDEALNSHLQQKLAQFLKEEVWDIGFFFCKSPSQGCPASLVVTADLVAVSEDLLVGAIDDSDYRPFDLESDFLPVFRKEGTGAFDAIQCDYHMALACRKEQHVDLYLISQRAGAGRMYYHALETGILFCSDLRFLLDVIPIDVNPLAIYSILKYGFIVDPLTISRNIAAVPPSHYLQHNCRSGEHSVQPFFRFQFDSNSTASEESLERVQSILKKSAAFLSKYPSAMLLSGGIDSSLYGCYLSEARREQIQAYHCAFGAGDPELPYAKAIAHRMGVDLKVVNMGDSDAFQALEDVIRFADHPFSDFSSLPMVFLLKYIREQSGNGVIVIECNGGDDCFGFGALQHEFKYRVKHAFPAGFKKTLAGFFSGFPYWKWECREGMVAGLSAMVDVHEKTLHNYFLVQAPLYYLNLQAWPEWDETLQDLIEQTSRNCSENYDRLGYEEMITVRQLLFTNSPRWTAKALSVKESLGLQLMYPFLWRDLLLEQGKIPWSLKVHNGIVKWPLKKLLENFMPRDFIYRKKSGFVPPLVQWLTDRAFNRQVRDLVMRRDGYVTQIFPVRKLDELLADALSGIRLRAPLLNTLWGAIFTECWIQEHRKR